LRKIVCLKYEPLKFTKPSYFIRNVVEPVLLEIENAKLLKLTNVWGKLTKKIVGKDQDLKERKNISDSRRSAGAVTKQFTSRLANSAMSSGSF
jgi:hypothetical protein